MEVSEFFARAPKMTHHAFLLLCPKLKKQNWLSLEFLKEFAWAFCQIQLTIHRDDDKETDELIKSPDLFVADNGRATLRLEDVEEISRLAQYPPQTARRRLFVIEHAERLNPNSANSLLKILEEPPAPSLFLLTSPHEFEVLPTILSRCQKVSVSLSSEHMQGDAVLSARDALSAEDFSWLENFFQPTNTPLVTTAESFHARAVARNGLKKLAHISEGADRLAKLYSGHELMAAVTHLSSQLWQCAEGQPSVIGRARQLRAEVAKWQEAEPFHPSTALWLTRILLLASA